MNQNTKKSQLKYMEVETDLRYKILNGEWKPGDKILSEEEYCTIYGVSRITVRNALRDLELEGLLYRRSGKGTFISNWQEELVEKPSLVKSFTNMMRELGKKAVTINVELNVIEADRLMAGYLGITPGEKIIELKRLRAVDGGDIIAYSINTFNYLPSFSTDPSDYYESLYEYLQSFGIYFNATNEYLEAILPPINVAHMLKIAVSEPVLKSVKISKNVERNFNEYNLCYYIGKKYRYYVEK